MHARRGGEFTLRQTPPPAKFCDRVHA